MQKHLKTLKEIISLTVDINRALDINGSGITTVEELLKERQTLTDRFAEQTREFVQSEQAHSPVEISDIVQQFEQQQTLMLRKLEHMRTGSKEHLARVVGHRKALQGYRISKTPDISYF